MELTAIVTRSIQGKIMIDHAFPFSCCSLYCFSILMLLSHVPQKCRCITCVNNPERFPEPFGMWIFDHLNSTNFNFFGTIG